MLIPSQRLYAATIVLDQDQTQERRALVADFIHSSRIKLVAVATERRQVQDAVESSAAQVGIVLPQGFSELFRKGQSAPLQVLVDGTNSPTPP